MTDGNESDASGLRARIDDITETLNVVAQTVSDLDRRVQLSQASITANDQRWEQRITTIESTLSELDAALRAETEQVRGSTSVVELLSFEIRTALAQNRDLAGAVEELRGSVGEFRQADAAGEFAALRARLDDFDGDFSSIATALAAIRTDLERVQATQLEPDAVLAALERVADRQPDLGPLLAAIERVPSSILDLETVLASVHARDEDISSLHGELMSLRLAQPELTPIHDELRDLRDRQVDLTPIHDELRELRAVQPDLGPVVDAIDALQASLPAHFREFEAQLPDLAGIATSLDRLAARNPDLTPVVEALDALRDDLPDLSPLLATDQQRDVDLAPVIDEIRSLARPDIDLTEVTDRLDAIKRATPDLTPVLENLQELRVSLGDSLHERIDGLLSAAFERQQTAAEEARRELRAIDDTLSPLGTTLAAVSDRLGELESLAQAHADRLDAQTEELIVLRDVAQDASAATPLMARLDQVSDEVRRTAGHLTTATELAEHLARLSTQLEAANRERADERAELADALDAVTAGRHTLEALAAQISDQLEAGAATDDSRRTLDAVVAQISDQLEAGAATGGVDLSDHLSRIEAVLRDSVTDIDQAVAARQFDHQRTLSELLASLPDPVPAIDELGRALIERARGGDEPGPAEVLARIDALAERTEQSLQGLRDGLEDRLSTLDESRATDVDAIRAAVDRLGSEERIVADRIQSLADQLATAATESDALWTRTADALAGVDRVNADQTGSLESLLESHRQLAEQDLVTQRSLDDVGRLVAEVRDRNQLIETAVASLSDDDTTDDRAFVAEAVDPLVRAVAELSHLAAEHRERLDGIARSVEAFQDAPVEPSEAHLGIERRIDALLDRQADLLESVRGLHPRLDELDPAETRATLGEILDRFATTEADLGGVVPRLESLRGTLDRTEQRLAAHGATLDRVDDRAERLVTTVSALADSTERLTLLDDLSAQMRTFADGADQVDSGALTEQLAELTRRVDDIRTEIGTNAISLIEHVDDIRTEIGTNAIALIEHVDAAAGRSADRVTVLEANLTEERERATEHLSTIAAASGEVGRELRQVRTDLAAQRREIDDRLETVISTAADVAESTRSLVAAERPDPASFDSLLERLDALEGRLAESTRSLRDDVAGIRSELAGQIAGLSAPIAGVTDRLGGLDLSELAIRLNDVTDQQHRTASDASAAMAASVATGDYVRDALADLGERVSALDLGAVRERLETLEHEQRATEQRLAESLSSVHAVVDSIAIEPVLSRLEEIEAQSGESERGLYAAIADVRTAALSLDLGHFDSRLAELEQRNRLVADRLSADIKAILTQLGSMNLDRIGTSLTHLEENAESQRDQIQAAVESLSQQLDLGTIDARLAALDEQARAAVSLETDVQTTVRALAGELATLDLGAVETRLEQLVDTVRATDEASRLSLAGEIDNVARRLSELDTGQLVTRLGDLTSASDRLSETVGIELAATVDRVRAVVADETEGRISAFADAADARSRGIQQELQALRETVVDQFSSASSEQRQSLIERIDTLGNTVVDRLDDTRMQTDALAAQVSSIHGAFARSGPADGDVRAHVDRALEGLAERIGAALRDLRREITDLGTSTDAAGLRSTFETAMDRLGNRFDLDFARVLEALSAGDEVERLRRIDNSITEIRRDFEVLRRLSEQSPERAPTDRSR